MLLSDINQKPLVRTCYSRYLKKFKLSLLYFNGLLKFLCILHQTLSNSTFSWNMNSVISRSFLNYTSLWQTRGQDWEMSMKFNQKANEMSMKAIKMATGQMEHIYEMSATLYFPNLITSLSASIMYFSGLL
jgi:hypothetical protein